MRKLRKCLGLIVCAVIIFAATVYLDFVEVRISMVPIDPAYPRPFPYPDTVLESLNAWLDKIDPAAHGGVRLHGHWHEIRMGVVVLEWICYGVSLLLVLVIIQRLRNRPPVPEGPAI